MVSKNTLRKLSDRELENYLKPESSFVPKAIQMAFEILTERGRYFSDEEKENIQKLINKKRKRRIRSFTRRTRIKKRPHHRRCECNSSLF